MVPLVQMKSGKKEMERNWEGLRKIKVPTFMGGIWKEEGFYFPPDPPYSFLSKQNEEEIELANVTTF